jgi:DNA-binding response OmpR family regulator
VSSTVSPLAASPPRILVMEDDLTVSEVVTRYLEREGFVVEVAYDGAVGLERALADPPELVVLDLMISVRNEGEGCRFTIRLPLAASPV